VTTRHRVVITIGAVIVTAILVVAFAARSERGSGAVGTTTTTIVPAGALRADIAKLVIADPVDGSGYRRDLFKQWIDADDNGCDTRCEVLRRELRTDLSGLSGGGWLSAYDDYTTDDASELDIDHIVPLEEAWVSGASTWGEAERTSFANDLESPELTAVTAAMNRSKGDRDPARWQPPNRDDWCNYIRAWVTVKLRWHLTADAPEVAALNNMAAATTCT